MVVQLCVLWSGVTLLVIRDSNGGQQDHSTGFTTEPNRTEPHGVGRWSPDHWRDVHSHHHYIFGVCVLHTKWDTLLGPLDAVGEEGKGKATGLLFKVGAEESEPGGSKSSAGGGVVAGAVRSRFQRRLRASLVVVRRVVRRVQHFFGEIKTSFNST